MLKMRRIIKIIGVKIREQATKNNKNKSQKIGELVEYY